MKKNDAWSRLNARVTLARRVVKSGLVKRVDAEIARMPSFSVDGRVFNARLKRVNGTGRIVATCWGHDELGDGSCQGMQYGHICWHILARILLGATTAKFYTTKTEGAWHIVSSEGGEIWVKK